MIVFENRTDKLRKYVKLWIATFVSAVLSYMVMISNGLTNTYDGLWNGRHELLWNKTRNRVFLVRNLNELYKRQINLNYSC